MSGKRVTKYSQEDANCIIDAVFAIFRVLMFNESKGRRVYVTNAGGSNETTYEKRPERVRLL